MDPLFEELGIFAFIYIIAVIIDHIFDL